MLASNLQRQNGFTLVELLIVVSLMAIIGVVFIGMASNFFVVINRTNQLSEITVDSQNLLRSTVENIRFGDGIRQTSQLVDPHAPAGGWNTSNTAFVIIIAVPALNASRAYIIDPNTGSPYMNELVYYKDGSTLMERKIANTSATGSSLHTTCPANLATASCTADIQLASYVSSMDFTLYDQDNAQTTTPALARSVKITLTMQRSNPARPITLTTTLQVTLRNRF